MNNASPLTVTILCIAPYTDWLCFCPLTDSDRTGVHTGRAQTTPRPRLDGQDPEPKYVHQPWRTFVNVTAP